MWLQIKKPDMEVIILDTNNIIMWEVVSPEHVINIDTSNQIVEGSESYELWAHTKAGSLLVIYVGTFSECHMVLNRILGEIGIKLKILSAY